MKCNDQNKYTCVRLQRVLAGAESQHSLETGWNAFGCMAAESEYAATFDWRYTVMRYSFAVNRVEPRATVSVIGMAAFLYI